MKKLLALCLAACVSVSVFTACDNTPAETTTAPVGIVDPSTKSYEVEDGLLLSCLGQADENGVYVIPETVTAIGESAFAGDTTLREIVIGSHVKSIGSGAFQGCTSLEKVTVAEGVETIGSYAFFDCTALSALSLPSTVDTLHPYTFYGCSALTEVSLPYIRDIGECAFFYCAALENVTLSDELERIGNWAFAQCTVLSETNLASLTKLVSIGDYAFSGCAMLRSVEIPDSVETIGTLAFYECTRLIDVKIGSSVKMVEYAAFHFTPWYQENDADYLVVGDGVLLKCGVHPNYIDLSDKGIKAIGATTFWNATMDGKAAEYGYKYAEELETIQIPDTVTVIGTSAFAGCYGIKEIVLPAGVTEIGTSAFNIYMDGAEIAGKIDYSQCTALETIGAYAFQGCVNVDTMELPASVKTVGAGAFNGTGAYYSFMDKAAKAEKDEDRFFITGDGILLAAYVPTGQSKVTIPAGVKKIAGAVFDGWDVGYIPEDLNELSNSGVSKYNLSYSVTEIVLPEGLTEIGDSAFYRMLSLQKIVLPSSLSSVGSSAFAFCTALSSVSGGSGIKTVGDSAFYYCTSLPAFQFSENTDSIGKGVFAGCSSLKTVTLPKGLAHPGTELFDADCVALTTVTMDPSARPFVYTILGSLPTQISVKYYKN